MDRLLTLDEVREQLGGIGRTLVFDLIKHQRLPSVKVGRRRLVKESDLKRYIKALDHKPVGHSPTKP